MKQDQISEVVRSDFGLHIIRVTGIKAERVVPLGEVRSDIAAEVKREASTRKFAEAVDAFNNTVYEQPDTLQPAAAQWKLVTQKSDWLRKEIACRPLRQPKAAGSNLCGRRYVKEAKHRSG